MYGIVKNKLVAYSIKTCFNNCMNKKFTDNEIIESANNFNLLADWRKQKPQLYQAALRRKLITQIKTHLIVQTTGAKPTYTEEELLTHAQQFKKRTDWQHSAAIEMNDGKVSHYYAAQAKGREFFEKCCSHMPNLRLPFTLEELKTSAAKFQHRSDWKKAYPQHYQAACRRKLLIKVAPHMIPKVHPYSGSYVVYTFEFTDKHAYIGHTFRPTARFSQHLQRGPVYEYFKVCPTYTYKILAEKLASPVESAQYEKQWIVKYATDGWTMLNKHEGGGLGTIEVVKWTKESVIAEARKYPNRQAWIDGSQVSYRIAKREGWFEKASAHMPKRILGIGKGRKFTRAHRRKLSNAKLGTKQSRSQCRARSKSLKAWWIRMNATPLGPP
jgi:predicted GIY-YIG superfamily endonuclease